MINDSQTAACILTVKQRTLFTLCIGKSCERLLVYYLFDLICKDFTIESIILWILSWQYFSHVVPPVYFVIQLFLLSVPEFRRMRFLNVKMK